MFMIPGFIIGAIIGGWRGYKKKGSKLDMLQFGAVYGIAFFILALFVSIALDWAGWV